MGVTDPLPYNFTLNGQFNVDGSVTAPEGANNLASIEDQLTGLGVSDQVLGGGALRGALNLPAPMAAREPLAELGDPSLAGRPLVFSSNTTSLFSPDTKEVVKRYNEACVEVMLNLANKLKNGTDHITAPGIAGGGSNTTSTGSLNMTNVYMLPEHYDNVKRWIGESVSTFLSTTDDKSLYLSDNEYKEVVKQNIDIINFRVVHDATGTAFDAFWIYDEKVHGKSIASRFGGLHLFKTRFNSQIGQCSMKLVSYIELSL